MTMNSTLQWELERATKYILKPKPGYVATIQGHYRNGEYHLDASRGKLIADYELVDHGIDGSQYFQGCSTVFPYYDHVVTGCGENPAEAIDDALDNLAQDGYELDGFEDQIKRDYPEFLSSEGEFSETPYAHAECESEEHDEDCEEDCTELHDDHDECELYYYVSIRVKGQNDHETENNQPIRANEYEFDDKGNLA